MATKAGQKQIFDSDDEKEDQVSVGEFFAGESGGEDTSSADGDEFDGGDIDKARKRVCQVQEETDTPAKLHVLGEERYQLPGPDELATERAVPPDLVKLKRRINDLVEVLTDFRSRRDLSTPRSEYVECLSQDLSDYYGYNRDLVDIFMSLFSPAECVQFLEANDSPRPLIIRVNTLKAKRRQLAQALMNRGVNLEVLASWTKVGLKIFESSVPVGATPEYLAGQYMLQAAASFLPVIALEPRPGERILDMCAAPGGKASHIAQLMENSGILVANDVKKDRCAGLIANLHRLGITNSVVCAMDGRKIPGAMKSFDRVLLDAPCTGLGVISRDPSIRTQKTREDVLKLAHLQKQLLLAAVDCVDAGSKTGGVIVYSTCSVTVEENEAVVNYLLRKRNVKIVPFHADNEEDIGKPGLTSYSSGNFHPSLALTRRLFPHVHNMDGFYVAKIKKLSNDVPAADKVGEQEAVDDATISEDAPAQQSDKQHNSKRKRKMKQGRRASDEESKGADVAPVLAEAADVADDEGEPTAVVSFLRKGESYSAMMRKKRKGSKKRKEEQAEQVRSSEIT